MYTLHDCCRHHKWDNSIEPALEINNGESAEIHMVEASDCQINPKSTKQTVETLDSNRANPVTGPIFINGAKPGDALKVTILKLEPSGWGWTANIPGFGLLKDDFPEAALHHWHYEPFGKTSMGFSDYAKIMLDPFIGTIGVAPAQNGQLDTIPPRHVGGNMDLKALRQNAELILPVECEGAMFSAGDPHAAQGHGEVCGTAIETNMHAHLKFEIIKDAAPKSPRILSPAQEIDPKFNKGYEITTGIGPDLMDNIKSAVKEMIDVLMTSHNLSAMDAYMLCSVCADLKISECVNAPNWTVAYYFPRYVFE